MKTVQDCLPSKTCPPSKPRIPSRLCRWRLWLPEYDSQLGAYIFTPKPGADLPKALAHYRTLALGEATVRVSSQQAILRVNDTEITFTGVPVWGTAYNLLKEINSELARSNAGVTIWKIN